uniref:Tyrosinase polyphenol oxidase n=1 Tax=Argemone mexicana TaxID=54796 RepID=D2SMN2_ARGME|nr:tyrosinase polyphenol oxidase [Argemone mexicana]
METKRWVSLIFLAFILLVLSSDLFLTDSQQQMKPISFIRDLKKTILGIFDGTWVSMETTSSSSTSEKKNPKFVVLSPNLTTCHKSLSDADRPVYCCPPKRESLEPIIDFQFPDISSPIRVRKPAHLVDADYIAKYNKAIAIMKSLPYDDPRNYMRQANMHCIYCTGAFISEHTNSLLKIHRSWMFFPWHRMMIYFHERILGSLIGDENFALPYWNWDSPDGMFIPDMYLNGSMIDTERDNSHLPPQVADINYDYVESGLGPEDQISTNIAFMYNQMVSGAKKTELFMGCPYKAGELGFCDGPGTIELAPHNALHTWVGSNLNTEREDLGAFYSAARDPIFYAHHSNIDRLWNVWTDLRGNNKPAIEDPEWLDSTFYFHNEKLELVRIRIRDVLDMSKLRYTYEKVDNVWLNAKPKPSVPPKIARQILKMRENENPFLDSSNQAIVLPELGLNGKRLDTTIRVKVHRPKTHRSKIEKEEEEEVLVVYGIEIKKDMYVKFDVYVNAVDETIIGPESREFAGTFVNMKRGVRLIMNKEDLIVKRKTVLKLGISELLEDLEAEGGESIWVTLVPRGGTGINTTIDGVRIEYMR